MLEGFLAPPAILLLLRLLLLLPRRPGGIGRRGLREGQWTGETSQRQQLLERHPPSMPHDAARMGVSGL